MDRILVSAGKCTVHDRRVCEYSQALLEFSLISKQQ